MLTNYIDNTTLELVEVGGVEPPSASLIPEVSTCLVWSLFSLRRLFQTKYF